MLPDSGVEEIPLFALFPLARLPSGTHIDFFHKKQGPRQFLANLLRLKEENTANL